jgi:DNA-binding MarR family transcriptional regulator
MKEGTQKHRVAKALADRDEPPTATELKKSLDIPDGSVDSALQNLRKDDYVDRHGEGGQHDPYRHRLTSKGEAAVANDEEEPDGPTGLDALGFGDKNDDAVEAANDGGTKPDAADEAYADAVRDTEGIPDPDDTAEPSTGAPTLGDDVVDVTYSTEEAVDLLLALGDADEPDFDTRRTFARSIVHELKRQG